MVAREHPVHAGTACRLPAWALPHPCNRRRLTRCSRRAGRWRGARVGGISGSATIESGAVSARCAQSSPPAAGHIHVLSTPGCGERPRGELGTDAAPWVADRPVAVVRVYGHAMLDANVHRPARSNRTAGRGSPRCSVMRHGSGRGATAQAGPKGERGSRRWGPRSARLALVPDASVAFWRERLDPP